MNINAARHIIATVRSSGFATFGGTSTGLGRIAGAPMITPRQAGVSVGLTLGHTPYDTRVGVMIVNPNAQTQAFVNQVTRLAGGHQAEVDVQTVGPMSATDPPAREPGAYYQDTRRPLEPGVSIGNVRENSAGTLGAFVRTADGAGHILSNNHVLACSSLVNAPRAAIGDVIVQPGRFDGATHPPHAVAALSNWVPIDPNDTNYVDCAIALLPGDAPVVVTYGGRHLGGFRPPILGEPVFKIGRSTGVTTGRIRMTETAEFPMNFHGQRIYFDEQIAIESDGNQPFSVQGDSGALIVSRDDYYAVGLLFGGNALRTLACPIDRVLRELSATLINY